MMNNKLSKNNGQFSYSRGRSALNQYLKLES